MIAQADAVRIPLADKSVHCCVTSPPYWGLRKYAGEQGEEPLGLEAAPERHVERIVEICREVRRVLRDDGVFWLNYGDCYSSGGGTHGGGKHAYSREANTNRSGNSGSLMMMPHRVALALQQDGWIVRQDLVWFKRNPMPESVNGWRWQREKTKIGTAPTSHESGIVPTGWRTESNPDRMGKGDYKTLLPEYEYGDDLELRKGSWRHTRAHEYVFMLVKGMQYWSNQEAVREKGSGRTPGNITYKYDGLLGHETKQGILAQSSIPQVSRNPRSVLDVPTAPYRGAHYATFPPNLIAPLIRATCPRWACPVCGQGWAAVVETGALEKQEGARMDEWNYGKHDTPSVDGGKSEQLRDSGFTPNHAYFKSVLGYKPTCEHPHAQEEAVPGIVFDPFLGSGTVGFVAKELQRRWVGIDISMEYLDEQARYRTNFGEQKTRTDDLPLFQLDAY